MKNRLFELEQQLLRVKQVPQSPLAEAKAASGESIQYSSIFALEQEVVRVKQRSQLDSSNVASYKNAEENSQSLGIDHQVYSGAFQQKTPQERLLDTMNYLRGLLGDGPVSYMQANKFIGGFSSPAAIQLSERISLGNRIAIIKDDDETERRRAKRAYILLLIKLEDASDTTVQAKVQLVEANYRGDKNRYDQLSRRVWQDYDKTVDVETLASRTIELRDTPLQFMKKYSVLPDSGLIRDIANENYGLITLGGTDNVSILPRMLLTPSGPSEYAFKLTYAPTSKQIKGVPIYFLPWKSARIVKMTLGDQANIFFTAAINGCSVFVEGNLATPTVYHAGITPPWPEMGSTVSSHVKAAKIANDVPLLWRELYWSKSAIVPRPTGPGPITTFGEVNKTHYISDGKTTASGAQTTVLVNNYESDIKRDWNPNGYNVVTCSPWGCVFGIRDPITNQWAFYLQENAVVTFIHAGQGYGTSRLLRLTRFFPLPSQVVHIPPDTTKLPDLTVPRAESGIFPI